MTEQYQSEKGDVPVRLSPEVMCELKDSGLLAHYDNDLALLLSNAIGRYRTFTEIRRSGGRILTETKPMPFFGEPEYRELISGTNDSSG